MRKLPPPRPSRLRRAFTVQNVLATIAVLVALSGTAFAATSAGKLTGKNVRNNSLTGLDVKNQSLNSTDFSSTTRTQLKAKTGPKGFTGAAGPTGAQGTKGATGAKGPDAARAYSYILADDTTSYLKPKTSNYVNPQSGTKLCDHGPVGLPAFLGFAGDCSPYAPKFPHWAYDCDALIPDYCGLGDTVGAAGSGATQLHTNPNGVVGFTGDENGSFVTLMGPGNIVVTASLTLLRPSQDEFHSRIACQPQVRRSNSADAYTNLGVPTMVSGHDVLEIVHMTVTGAAYFAQPGDYDYQISCALVDEYNTGSSVDNWYFVTGNATATTTEM